MYVKKTDYAGRISASLLDILIDENPLQILKDSSKEAEDIIASMAGVLYDIAPEFEKNDATRNYYILNLAKSIALYFIYQRADDEEIPPKVIKNYDDAMDDLEKISIGKKAIDMPPKIVVDAGGGTGGDEGVSTSGTGLRRMGSQAKRTHIV